MENNKLVVYNTANVTNTTTAAMKGQVQKIRNQNLLITRQLELEIDKNQYRNLRIIKAISRNAAIEKIKAGRYYRVKEKLTILITLKIITK